MSVNILYVLTRSDAIGGAVVHVRDLAKHLLKKNWNVTVAIGGNGIVIEHLKSHGLVVMPIRSMKREPSPFHDFIAFRELCAIIKKVKPDIVSAHTSKAGVLARLACFYRRLPCIYTPHCWAFSGSFSNRRLYEIVEKTMAPLAKVIIQVSHNEKSQAISARITCNDKLQVIHNGMPYLDFSKRDGTNFNCLKMIMVARFEEQKDHKTLFRALVQLKDYNWSIDFVGDGPLIGWAKLFARDNGLQARCKFWGEVYDVPERLRESDLFLLITNWEGFPRSILEALRAGLPCIVSDVGGCSEAVVDGKNGYLIPKSDVGLLVDRLCSVFSMPQNLQTMGEESRKLFEEQFRFDTMAEKTEKLYLSCLASK